MFYPFFDDKVYADDDLVDVLKVEDLLMGLGITQFSGINKPSKDEFRDILNQYGKSFDSLSDELKPNLTVYYKLIKEQFDHMYQFFMSEDDLMSVESNMQLVHRISESNKVFDDHVMSMLPEEFKIEMNPQRGGSP